MRQASISTAPHSKGKPPSGPTRDTTPLVAVIGLGGVGSNCAHALVRAGMRRLRLVDFDRVSLSSLNRHAVAVRRDVGTPKVIACAEHFEAISTYCEVDARDDMFTAERAHEFLDADEGCPGLRGMRPAIVVDCIDDVPTKADLLEECLKRGLPVICALGSACKGDPTKLCVTEGLHGILKDKDRLASKLRMLLEKRGVDVSGIPFVYSSQKLEMGALPLTAEQEIAPEEFGALAHFRIRVLPVLGSQPTLAGIFLAVRVMAELAEHRLAGLTAGRWPLRRKSVGAILHRRSVAIPTRHLAEKLLLGLRERAEEPDYTRGSFNLTVDEALFLVNDVWGGRSALNEKLAVGVGMRRFALLRWDPEQPVSIGNVILCAEGEVEGHRGPASVHPDVRLRVESALRRAEAAFALPDLHTFLELGVSAFQEGSRCDHNAGFDRSVCRPPQETFTDVGIATQERSTQALSGACLRPKVRLRPDETKTKEDGHEENAMSVEQLSRSAAFFGEQGHAKICASYVVVVGVGAVGSVAASLLLRAGVQRLRLVDGGCLRAGSCHGLGRSVDVGANKAETSKRMLLGVRPRRACVIEAVAQHLTSKTAPDVLDPAAEDGRQPDLVLDCVGGTDAKVSVLLAALARNLRVVTVVACPGFSDPTRLAALPLSEVHQCPVTVAMRLALAAQFPAWATTVPVEAVHSQRFMWNWAKAIGSAQSPQFRHDRPVEEALARLSLGAAGAAMALRILSGERRSSASFDKPLTAWAKLEKDFRAGLEADSSIERSVPPLSDLDTHAVGCMSEQVWCGRSALSRRTATNFKYGGLRLVRWDVSVPAVLSNLILLTEEEAREHAIAVRETGSLPAPLLQALRSRPNKVLLDGEGLPDANLAENGNVLLMRQLRVHGLLRCLRKYLQHAACGGSPDAATLSTPKTLMTDDLSVGSGFGAADDLFTTSRGSEAFAGSFRSASGFADLVGGTPLVELKCLSEATGCRIVAKAEFMSPGGCQKDRVARQIVEEAEATGRLRLGATIVEGTSGSTGISLCLAAIAKGYRVLIVMPDDQAAEKVQMLRQFGAEVELVRPASISSPSHYVNVARKRAEELNAVPGGPGAFFADQFESLANFRAHFSGTGPELWSQCGHSLDAFVMSAGTGGTLAGIGCFLKGVAPDIRIYLADVTGSSLYNKVVHGVLYATQQAERTVRRHRSDTIAEGIGIDRLTANFARGLKEHNGGVAGIDDAVRVSDQEALEMAHYILTHEGIFIGSSAAVNCVGACKVANVLGPGHIIATILCDSGLRHLTKFYNPKVWPAYGLDPPVAQRSRGDLSFIGD